MKVWVRPRGRKRTLARVAKPLSCAAKAAQGLAARAEIMETKNR